MTNDDEIFSRDDTPLTDPTNVLLRVVEDDDVVQSENVSEGYTLQQAYALLRGRGPETLTAAGDPVDGAMIALLPDETTLLHLPMNPEGPGWLGPADLHVTLLFLGDAVAWDRVARNDVIDHVRATLRESPVAGPVAGDAFATAHFNPEGEDPCWVLLIGSCPDLLDLRGHLEEVFLDGDPSKVIPEQHVPYVPHMTLRYSDSDEEAGRVREYLGHVSFDRLRVSFGTDVTDIPLGAHEEERAR